MPEAHRDTNDSDALEKLFDEAGPLACARSAYRKRPEQLEMARKVAKTFEAKGVLLADAPTGTGKSLSYLSPAVLSGEKVFVSTATLALQHQLLTEDLPPPPESRLRTVRLPRGRGLHLRGDEGTSQLPLRPAP
jgi:ATP-dependent DNA helicase DinG